MVEEGRDGLGIASAATCRAAVPASAYNGGTVQRRLRKKLIECVSTAVLGVALLSSAALAQSKLRVAVLGFAPGEVSGTLAAELGEALRQRVARLGTLKLAPGKSLEEIKLVFGCVDGKAACMTRVGRQLGVDRLIWGVVRAEQGRFRVTLKMLNVTRGVIVARPSGLFSEADLHDPVGTVSGLSASLFPRVQSGLILVTNIAPTAVLVDGQRIDTTGTVTDLGRLAPGPHTVEVHRPGYRSWRGRVQTRAGQTLELRLNLRVLGAGIDEAEERSTQQSDTRGPLGWRIAFWSAVAASVGLGVGMLVSGLSVRSLESDKEDEIRGLVAQGEQPQAVFDGLTQGNACEVAEQASARLDDICHRGKARATLFNALFGASLVSLIATGYLGYRAYFARDGLEYEVSRPAWRLLAGADSRRAELGLALDF